MNADDLIRVLASDSDIKLIFINEDVKKAFYLQLSAPSMALFEELEKNIYYN
jgi:hypothetical protein